MTNDTLKQETLVLFADNITNEISASDMRQYVENIWLKSEDKIYKINKFADLPTNNVRIFENSIVAILDEGLESGLYLSLSNQPIDKSELKLISGLPISTISDGDSIDTEHNKVILKPDSNGTLETLQVGDNGLQTIIYSDNGKEASINRGGTLYKLYHEGNLVGFGGIWKQNTTYKIGDLVSYEGKVYSCKIAHNSGTVMNFGNWFNITASEFDSSKLYLKGDIITAKTTQGTWDVLVAKANQTGPFISSNWDNQNDGGNF
jgi:hypothetical protein